MFSNYLYLYLKVPEVNTLGSNVEQSQTASIVDSERHDWVILLQSINT